MLSPDGSIQLKGSQMRRAKITSHRWNVLLAAGIILGFVMTGVLLTSLAPELYAAPDFQGALTPTATPDPVSIFEDATGAAGVAFTGAQFGASWGDYDNDGWVDLLANNHWQDRPNVYHNNGNGTFTDVYTTSGILDPIRDPHGSSWGDFDNDGDLDLYVTTARWVISPFFVQQGIGSGIFLERAVQAGIADLPGRGRTANWIDYDHDGDLDLFKGNAIQDDGPDRLYRNNGWGTFSDVSDVAGLHDTWDTQSNVWGDYDDDGDMDVVLTGGESVRLYRNDGDGTFTYANWQAGITWEGRSWGADFGDYDNDGDLDLYIARGNYTVFDHVDVSDSMITYTFHTQDEQDGFDFQTNSGQVTFDTLIGDGPPMPLSQVYIGATEWHPAAIPFTLGAATDHYGEPSYTPGSDVGAFIWQDAPGDTWHFRVSNIRGTQGQLRTAGTFTNVVGVDIDSGDPYDSAAKYNRLYENQGDGTFEEVGSLAGVGSGQDSRTATWLDYNNDGFLDLYVINSGNVQVGNQANHLYRNNRDGTFTDVAEEASVQAITPGLGDCVAYADYDHNGFLDLFVVTDGRAGYLGGPHKLYRNLGNGNHWLEINLVGTISNRQGVGSKVVLSAGGMTQTRQMNNGSHYLCQNDTMLHFGLGGATYAGAITVAWPSGLTEVWPEVSADQILTITEMSTPTPTPTPTITPDVPSDDIYLPLILRGALSFSKN
jgi:hypothetical protein